jgi:hypothetical protein
MITDDTPGRASRENPLVLADGGVGVIDAAADPLDIDLTEYAPRLARSSNLSPRWF